MTGYLVAGTEGLEIAMAVAETNISISVDGFVIGPNTGG
jgi:hypothetical protein